MTLPKDRKYSEYTWIRVEGNIATIGVTDYALHATREIVFVELPKKGSRVKKGEKLLSLESVKWSGHVISPLSGEIIDVNEELFDEPERLNKDPYGTWICRIKIANTRELESLVEWQKAEKWTVQK